MQAIGASNKTKAIRKTFSIYKLFSIGPAWQEEWNVAQGRVPVPMTISSGMFNSLPFQNFFRVAKISALA
jgi:hypothetical protein